MSPARRGVGLSIAGGAMKNVGAVGLVGGGLSGSGGQQKSEVVGGRTDD